ncbi:hypothetical protein BS78_06G050500 [Paspalum vaginatum]|nr:hypothetical protein BS78_06G050500 [Paspalum vaginatum]
MDEANPVMVDELGQEADNGVVREGLKTDKGFKEVHCNAVTKDLVEFVEVPISGTQEHKVLSVALWDDTNFMISLEQEHYNGHCKAHPKDAEFLNTPILHYQPMEAIFGDGVATDRYAMVSTEPLDIPEGETIDLYADTPVQADDTLVVVETKPKIEPTKKAKRKRVSDDEAALSVVVGDAILGLYQAVMACPGYSREALMATLGHLTEKKAVGLMFVEMTNDGRDLWLRTYLAKNYYM